MNKEEKQMLKLSGLYTAIALVLISLFWLPLALPQTQTAGYSPYDPKIVPPKHLGEFSRVFRTLIVEVGTDGTFYIPVGTTAVTGSGTAGRVGTSTARDLSLPMFGWNGSAWVFKAGGSTTAWNTIPVTGSDFVTKWKVDNDEGTGTQSFVAGTGISIVGTVTNGVGTITINAVGTSSAGGWTDTGTQTIASTGYLVRLGGQLILHADGISGLVDSMIPNTITLDNITQITNRSLANMQGTVNNGQVDDDITLTNITQITNRSLANMQGDIELGTQTTGDYLTNWNCDGQIGIGAVNFETTDFDIVTAGGTKTVNLSAIAKGTTSPTAAYLVKLDGTGKVSTAQLPGLGDYTSKSVDTSYQAATDGFVIATINADHGGDRGYIVAYCDASNPPTTAIAYAAANYNPSVGNETWVQFNTITLPVKKNNYYKIALSNSNGTCVTTIYFIPLQ